MTACGYGSVIGIALERFNQNNDETTQSSAEHCRGMASLVYA